MFYQKMIFVVALLAAAVVGVAHEAPTSAGGAFALSSSAHSASDASPVVRLVTGEVRGAGYDRRIRAVGRTAKLRITNYELRIEASG